MLRGLEGNLARVVWQLGAVTGCSMTHTVSGGWKAPSDSRVVWTFVLHAAASGHEVLHAPLLRPATLACQLPVGLWRHMLQPVLPAVVGALADMAPASNLETSVVTASGIMTLHTAHLTLVNPDAADCERW